MRGIQARQNTRNRKIRQAPVQGLILNEIFQTPNTLDFKAKFYQFKL